MATLYTGSHSIIVLLQNQIFYFSPAESPASINYLPTHSSSLYFFSLVLQARRQCFAIHAFLHKPYTQYQNNAYP